MQGHIDESEFVKNHNTEDEITLLDSVPAKEPLLKKLKGRVFNVFFRMNTLKSALAIHYHMVMVLIETFQLLSLVLVDGDYSSSGPYNSGSPWNLTQTQWLIDVCWVFRVDRYFRTSLVGYVLLMCIWAGLVLLAIVLGVFLGIYQKPSSFSNFLLKTLKVLATLLCDLLFIPIVDSLAFGMKCSLSPGTQCMSMQQGYQYLFIFIAGACVFLLVVGLCALLYYDFCLVCGGVMAKPHPRIKLLRLLGYTIVVFSFYFTTTSAEVILFLLISLGVGTILSYIHTQYMPYYNSKICKLRLGAIISFTSAVFCLLIGEFFKTTDQTNSSVTMLFYFLTPCLVQITQLALAKRGKSMMERKMQHISNMYQVEIKGRMHVMELEAARNRSAKSLYGEGEEEVDEDFKNVQSRSLHEIETLYSEAFKKFPNSEYLYLWSGILQLHMFESYVLAMIQCFKGMLIANKLDSQYAFYHFCRSSTSCYKQYMKDDAYDYVLFERCFANAQRNDESVTRSQFFFWSELESKAPKIQKLTKLAGETSHMIGVAKNNYQLLIKLNSKSTQALRMYGGFLSSLNNFTDVGQRYIQKADLQDEAQGKGVNANVLNTLTQPLSFFESDSAIITVSGDFETIGEILKVNTPASQIFGYLQAELVGRNVSLIIPSPFTETHDELMRRYHESGTYSIVDNGGLVLYFINKKGYIFEARTLVKVVPNEDNPPFLMAVVLPTKPGYYVMLLNTEFYITGSSEECETLFDLGTAKNSELQISTVIENFEEMKERMKEDDPIEAKLGKEGLCSDLKCKLSDFILGAHSAFVLKVMKTKNPDQDPDVLEKSSEFQPSEATQEGRRQVSILKTATNPSSIKIGFSDTAEIASEQKSSSESEEESHSSSEESGSSDEESSSNKAKSGEKQSLKKGKSDSRKVEIIVKKPLFGSNSSGPEGSEEKTGGEVAEDQDSDSQRNPGKIKPSGDDQEASKSVSDSKSPDSEESDKEEEEEEEEEEENADNRSGFSSSKSMGSSMASLAYFNKAIKALISFEFARTKKYVWRFKLTLILTIVLLIITSILTFQVIKSSTVYNGQLSHFVNLVGNTRLYSISLAYYVRVIALIDAGFIQSDNRSEYFQWMSWDSTDMHDINLNLYQNYDLISASDRQVYIEESIPTWLMESGNVRLITTNLFDATSNEVLQAFLIKQEMQTQPLLLSNRRTYYVYRNGEGELLSYLNDSTQFYIDSALRNITQQRLTAILLILASVFLLLFCAGFAIIPAIRTLEKSKREVWDIFFEIPSYVCRVMKGRCNERLNLLNESANVDLDDQKDGGNPEEDKEADEYSKRDPSKPSKSQDKEKLKKSRQSSDNRKMLSYDPRQRKMVLLKLSCFFLISVVYFYLIYYTGFDTIGGVLEEEPVTINWASRRRELSRAVNFWALESILENVTDFGFKDIVPSGQNLGSPFRLAVESTNELEYVENSLIFGNVAEGLSFNEILGSTHDQLLFSDACIAPVNRSLEDCSTVGNRAMMQGLHSALGMYVTLSRTVLQTIASQASQSNYSFEAAKALYESDDMKLLRDMDENYLYDPLLYSSELYESDYQVRENQVSVWQDVLISLYSVFAIVFFFLVYHPMIHKVRSTQIGQDTKNAWSMCTLIPQEYQEEFKLLNVAIKDRRDSFKWR